jgi:MoxR-like ATPase
LAIVARFGGEPPDLPHNVVAADDVVRWRHAARAVYIEPRIVRYAVDLVAATREPTAYIERGASPRATLALIALARARAFVDGRAFVVPDDMKALAPAVLRHRLAFTYRVATDGVDTEELVAGLIGAVPAP